MENLPECLQCSSNFVYADGELFICPECGHEFNDADTDEEESAVIDSNGNILKDGDSIMIIKDLKLKGSSDVIKVGTKVKNIRLLDNDHNIDCKIDVVGKISLKSEFVKKL